MHMKLEQPDEFMNLNDDNSRGNHVTALYATQMPVIMFTTACNWPLILKQW